MFNFFACWETLHAFFVVDFFSKLTFFYYIYFFHVYHHCVKQFGFRSSPTSCRYLIWLQILFANYIVSDAREYQLMFARLHLHLQDYFLGKD